MTHLRTDLRVLSLPLVFALTGALTSLAGCATRGSGTPASEARELEPFDKIELGGVFELVVHVQPGVAQKLEVTADDNLLEKVQTSVSGGELEVELEGNSFIRPKTPIRVEVWVPALLAIDASGASDIEVDGLYGERFELELSGASDSTLRGVVDRFEIEISGAADLDAKQLHAKVVELELSGAGEANISVSDELDVDISGAGEVNYWGSPDPVKQKISGAGELNKRD